MRLFATFLLVAFIGVSSSAQYNGKFIGKLSELHHGVSGEVYAVDGRTLFIKDFTYDGQGPAAYFYAGHTRLANSNGFRLRDENGSPKVIKRYKKEGVTLTLPEGKTLNNIKIFYVWCEEFEVNFGDVKIPRNFDFPRPQKINPLKGVHAISSDNIVVVDAQTLLIPNLSYDGEAPDAKFWVGRGPKPSPQGIRVPDENGKEVPLRRYDKKTVVLTLPGDLTVFDIGHFGIWCEAFTVDFGHVQIPANLNVPPSLKMLGVSPQSKLNCEVLYDDLAFEVRWAIAGDSIVLQLVAKLDDREYMSFGVSEDETKSIMIGGDVVVAWVDKETLKGYAEDYYLEAKSQCSGPTGSCPDTRLAENTNSIRLLNAAMVNGYSIVTYQRPLQPSDQYDHLIHTNKSQAVIWAIGPLNQRNEVSFHTHYPKGDSLIDFGRPAKWNCPMPESEQPPMKAIPDVAKSKKSERRQGTSKADTEKSSTNTRGRTRDGQRGNSNYVRAVPTPAAVSKSKAWEIPPIQCYEPEDGVFYAQMGPTGGKHGYPAITGHVGWGISWYINGLLIPEINVVRGRTYNFVVEGGVDPDVPAKFHPFYITDDPVGGYEHKTDEEKKNVRIFAGVSQSKPIGVGRLCHWTQVGDIDADDFESFGAYQRHLELKCDQGEPGVIQWTPDRNTPDTVYYQCFTHRYLGWKINVLDSCDLKGAGSELKPSIVEAPKDLKTEDLVSSSSVQVETRVKPNNLINEDKEDKDKSTVSEKSPLGPKRQPTEPILIQSQQSFIPQIYMDPGLFAQNTYHPYIIETPVYYNPYQHMFRPSPVIHEEVTSTKPETTTPASLPKTEKIIAANTDLKPVNETVYFPPLKRPFRPINQMIIRKPNYQNFLPNLPMKFLRSPPVRPPFKPMYKPMKFPRQPFPKYPLKTMFLPNLPKRPPQFVIMKPQIRLQASSTVRSQIEKEPEIQTAPSEVKPLEPKLPQIVNSGFHPDSVVIESGFKPIVHKDIHRRTLPMGEPQIQRRILDEIPAESNLGVIDLTFEPVFVPSPKDKKLANEDEITAAAERIESYYLPPPSQTKRIDLDSPPAVVVTYDGKKVSGASLTAKIDRLSATTERASQAAELLKIRPQFVPFKGELPPLNPEYINSAAQIQSSGFINRNLDSPTPPTKLKLIRKVRAAHHTPEHTAEQKNNIPSNSVPLSLSLAYPVVVALIFMFF